MIPFPRTLLQIHYHDRPCGVTQVMRWYARAFCANQRGHHSISRLLCAQSGREGYQEFTQNSLISLRSADYRAFDNVKSYRREADRIERRLFEEVTSSSLPGPIAVVAHNLFLSKNAALVSAFARVARTLGKDDRYRFFTVVHDLPEEGRVAQLTTIAALRRWGVSIDADRMNIGGRVGVVAINSRIASVLRKAGLSVSIINNPVISQKRRISRSLKNDLRRYLREYCKKNHVEYNPDNSLFVNPSRTVVRKNPIESVVLSCLLLEGTLLIGPSGVTEEDRCIHDSIRRLALEFKLPVVSDIQEVIRGFFPDDDPIPYLYALADGAVSTSVAESFGYLLYEPFLYGKPVMGRIPSGFRYAEGIENPLLYDRLPVPIQWVNTRLIKRHFHKGIDRSIDASVFRKDFFSELDTRLNGDTVDFALLDDRIQFDLVRRVLSSKRMKAEWKTFLKKHSRGWPGLSRFLRHCSSDIINKNRRAIEQTYSYKRFMQELIQCFSKIPKNQSGSEKGSGIQHAFKDPRCFRVRY
jgi:hypothetical protein